MRNARHSGFTLVELTVVLLILTILATISISVFTSFIVRARITRAHADIAILSQAIAAYETDLGVFPPSHSESTTPLNCSNQLIPGNGFLMEALLQSIGTGASATNPSDPAWAGPYIEVSQAQQLDFLRFSLRTPAASDFSVRATTFRGDVCMRDPWGNPYSYVIFTDYVSPFGTELDATLVVDSPFAGPGVFYNPTTFQIYSTGPDRQTRRSSTLDIEGRGPGVPDLLGVGPGLDDVTNFSSP